MTELIAEITVLSLEVSLSTPHDVFVELSPHVNEFEVRVYRDGWYPNANPNQWFHVYYTDSDAAEELERIKQALIELSEEELEGICNMEELVTCELCFWDDVDPEVQCEKCGRYFCEDCGSYGECICNDCKEK